MRVPAAGVGVRFGSCLLAAAGRVAGGRGVGGAPAGAAGRVAGGGPSRLLPRHRRRLSCAGQAGRSSPKVGPSPVDRGRPGSKHHVLTDARGTPLRVSLTGGHRHDVTGLLTLIDSLGPGRASGAAPGANPGCCMPTAARTTTSIAADCASVASHRRSLDGAGRTARVRARSAGTPSPPTPGSVALAACGSGGSTRGHARRLTATRPLHDTRPQAPGFCKHP